LEEEERVAREKELDYATKAQERLKDLVAELVTWSHNSR
jgi:hypothetical protein